MVMDVAHCNFMWQRWFLNAASRHVLGSQGSQGWLVYPSSPDSPNHTLSRCAIGTHFPYPRRLESWVDSITVARGGIDRGTLRTLSECSTSAVRGQNRLTTGENRLFRKNLNFGPVGQKGPKNGPPGPENGQFFFVAFSDSESLNSRKKAITFFLPTFWPILTHFWHLEKFSHFFEKIKNRNNSLKTDWIWMKLSQNDHCMIIKWNMEHFEHFGQILPRHAQKLPKFAQNLAQNRNWAYKSKISA